MKKYAVCLVIMILCALYAQSQERSQNIVFISGERYYVHTVAEGETLYSLSKLYDVTIPEIESNNS